MLRLLQVVAAVAVLSVGGLAYGQQQVVSFSARGPALTGAGLLIIPSAPDGFVMTDIYAGHNGPFVPSFALYKCVDLEIVGVAFRKQMDGTNMETHLVSGVPLVAGEAICAGFEGLPVTDAILTISGYIASGSPSGNVPAVSTWGLIVMAMLMLSAGTLVMTRRRSVVG